MKILISSGGTSEAIDQVRAITNHSTGQLGANIAQNLIDNDYEVFYICSKDAIKPVGNYQLITISDVKSLKIAIEELLSIQSFTWIIHAMAISDYTLEHVFAYDSLKETIIKNYQSNNNLELSIDLALHNNEIDLSKQSKISSHNDSLIMKLKKNEKIIAKFKELNPFAKLIGFKLLNEVSEEELINTAYKLLLANDCDYVVANDLVNINKLEHKALIIDKEKKYLPYHTKKEIAQAINNIIKGDN